MVTSIVGLQPAPFPFKIPRPRRIKTPCRYLSKPETASLPKGLNLNNNNNNNNNNNIVRFSGYWQHYQRCEQLSSRVRFDKETIRKTVRVVQGVRNMPVSWGRSVCESGYEGIALTLFFSGTSISNHTIRYQSCTVWPIYLPLLTSLPSSISEQFGVPITFLQNVL
jgi:hypothetical protein